MGKSLIDSRMREHQIQIVGFTVGRELFGADILKVREILRETAIEPLPEAPDFVLGVVKVRGNRVPVIDFGQRTGQATDGGRTDIQWILVARSQGMDVGYRVDAVTRIVKISSREILPAPEIILVGLRSQYIRGVCNTDLGLMIYVNLEQMIGDDDIQALRSLVIR